MKCKEFFDSVKRGESKLSKELQTRSESIQVAWEDESASSYSPGVVQNAEVLARQIVDPTHFDRVTGTIKPTFFDDAASIGASCHRLNYIDYQTIQKMTEQRVAQANQNPPSTGPRTAIGYASVTAKEVRSIRPGSNPNRRGSAVYDTAKSDDNSHADICQLVSNRQEGKSVRAQLWELAKNRLMKFPPPQTNDD